MLDHVGVEEHDLPAGDPARRPLGRALVAFRDSLWWLVGTNGRDAGLGQLTVLMPVVAAAAGGLALVASPSRR
jgi:hypothetical protein